MAASADASANRRILRDAIEKVLQISSKIDVPERDGVFNLPFRGPISSIVQAFSFSPEGIGGMTRLNVSVVFKTPGTAGRVRIRVANNGLDSDVVEFRQNHPGKAVVVPLSDAGIAIESADVGISAVLVVALA